MTGRSEVPVRTGGIEVAIVSGLSGAGRSTAAKVLEDLGWFVVDNLPPELIENAQSIIAMDPPRHTKMRRLVASAFTPKQMRRIQDASRPTRSWSSIT